MPIADEIAAAAVLNELVCRERMHSRLGRLIDSRQRRPML
jgi:hypothetical protein